MPYLEIISGGWREGGATRTPILLVKTEQGDKYGINVIRASGSSERVTDENVMTILQSARLDDPAMVWLYRQAVEALAAGRFVPHELTELELYQAFAERVHV